MTRAEALEISSDPDGFRALSAYELFPTQVTRHTDNATVIYAILCRIAGHTTPPDRTWERMLRHEALREFERRYEWLQRYYTAHTLHQPLPTSLLDPQPFDTCLHLEIIRYLVGPVFDQKYPDYFEMVEVVGPERFSSTYNFENTGTMLYALYAYMTGLKLVVTTHASSGVERLKRWISYFESLNHDIPPRTEAWITFQ